MSNFDDIIHEKLGTKKQYPNIDYPKEINQFCDNCKEQLIDETDICPHCKKHKDCCPIYNQ